jgi:Domain of unknown function (DUF4278)
MNLTYRGTSYEVPALTQSSLDSTDQPKIKLCYRGNTFEYILRPTMISEEDETDWPIIPLCYRGTTSERKIKPLIPYQKPRTINWRW